MRRSIVFFSFVVIVCSSAPALSILSPVAPVGEVLKVNGFVAEDQVTPRVAGLNDRFAVVWRSEDGSDDLGPGIFLRYVDAEGTMSSSDVRISGTGAAAAENPWIATRGGDGLIVGWVQDDDRAMISLIDGAGVPAPPVEVAMPAASVLVGGYPDGTYLVVWVDESVWDNARSYGSRFSADGSYLGAIDFPQQSLGSNWWVTDLATRSDGSLLVSHLWVGEGMDVHGTGSNRYDANGEVLFGDSSCVAVGTFCDAGTAAVGRGGGSIEGPVEEDWSVWSHWPPSEMYLDRRTAEGALVENVQIALPSGPDFRAVSLTTGVDGQDGIATLWIDPAPQPGGLLYVVQFTPQGEVITTRSVLAADSSPAKLDVRTSRLAAEDTWLVVWEDDAVDGDGHGIAGRLVERTLFADGFESGDVGAWTQAAAP